MLVLGERRVIRNLLLEVQPGEPTVGQMHLDFLQQMPLLTGSLQAKLPNRIWHEVRDPAVKAGHENCVEQRRQELPRNKKKAGHLARLFASRIGDPPQPRCSHHVKAKPPSGPFTVQTELLHAEPDLPAANCSTLSLDPTMWSYMSLRAAWASRRRTASRISVCSRAGSSP